MNSNINTNICSYCSTNELIPKEYPLKIKKIILSEFDYKIHLRKYMLLNLRESWTTRQDQLTYNNTTGVEGCLFMLNFSNNGNLLATTTENNFIDIWSLDTKEKLFCLADHKEIVTFVEWFKSDSSAEQFASCSLDKTIKIWKNFKCVETLKEHEDWLRCISISNQNHEMISGCVSSVIVGWDLEKFKISFRIENEAKKDYLNTINTLNFQHESNIFLSGTRDGYIKLYDPRTNNNKVISQFIAHTSKLNSGQFSSNDMNILTSGRDNAIRLWDIRKISNETMTNKENLGALAEYNKHKCTGYNIAVNYLNYENYLITGSEDSHIYIYDKLKKDVVKTVKTKGKINHLVRSYPNPTNVSFAFSSLQENKIHFYEPFEITNEKKEIRSNEMEEEKEDESLYFLEDMMTEYGDLILKIFHKNNYTYSSQMTLDNLFSMVTKDSDEESKHILHKFQSLLLKKITSLFNNENKDNNIKKSEENLDVETKSKISISSKCRLKLHNIMSKHILKLIQMNEEINNSKTLNLISLLP